MKSYTLRPRADEGTGSLPGMPVQLDRGDRTLRVYRKASSLFILASCARRSLHAACLEDTKSGAFLVTVQCSKEQFEEVRDEFNSRPLSATNRQPTCP